ncbi:MAG: hypothetical protein PHD07_07850 [Bacteroidales bacterium]|nr:hypothetical protein [Bacteroidales bacterium]MDD3200543.1 hypothetical protein [Bacteroidales bacterium]
MIGIICLVLAASSCSDNISIDSAYGCGVYGYKSSVPADLGLITNYIQKQGAPYGTVIIRGGKSEKANDATIKAQFEAAVAKMDFSKLGLDASTSFTYSVQSTYTEGGSSKTIASYSWPK